MYTLNGRKASDESTLTLGGKKLPSDAEKSLTSIKTLDWTVAFPGDAIEVTSPEVGITMITIDLTKATWFDGLGLTQDILVAGVYVPSTGGSVKQIIPGDGLVISADAETAYLEFSPSSTEGTILLRRMQDARTIPTTEPPPEPMAPAPEL